MVELITVIMILGILSAVALPRFFDNGMFESRAAADQVKSILRYGQKAAIASRSSVTVSLSAAAEPVCVASVAGGIVSCQIKDSVPIDKALPWTATFDWMGRPVPNAAATVRVGTTTISIAEETGYVY